jgi:hypothetical protein
MITVTAKAGETLFDFSATSCAHASCIRHDFKDCHRSTAHNGAETRSMSPQIYECTLRFASPILRLFAQIAAFRTGTESVLFFLKVQLPVWCSRDADDCDVWGGFRPRLRPPDTRGHWRGARRRSRGRRTRGKYEAATCASPRSMPTASDRARSTSVPAAPLDQ